MKAGRKIVCIIICLVMAFLAFGCAVNEQRPTGIPDTEGTGGDTESRDPETGAPGTEDTDTESGDTDTDDTVPPDTDPVPEEPDYMKYYIIPSIETGEAASISKGELYGYDETDSGFVIWVLEGISLHTYVDFKKESDMPSPEMSYGQLHYTIKDDTHTVTDSDESSDTLLISADAADIYVRRSTYSFHERANYDVGKRIFYEPMVKSTEFPTPYDIVWSDITAKLTRAEKSGTDGTDGEEPIVSITYSGIESLSFGYSIKENVTVNAFIAKTEDGLSVLVDPEYMYGIPMFEDSQFKFLFGGTGMVWSDSIFLTASLTEELSGDDQLEFTGYAYARVVLSGIECVCSYPARDVAASYTCTVSGVEVLDEFTDIVEYSPSDDDTVISAADKDPEVQRVYDTVMAAKDEIYTDDTQGIVFLDLDFDGTPEVLVTTTETETVVTEHFTRDVHTVVTRVYSVGEEGLEYIDTMRLPYTARNALGAFIAKSELQDGTGAWYVVVSNDEDKLLTLENGALVYNPLFSMIVGEDSVRHYYYFDEEIVPEEINTRTVVRGDIEETYEEYIWHGITSWPGLSTGVIYDRARMYYTESLEKIYSLYSSWIGTVENWGIGSYGPVRYTLTPREFAHRIAFLIDDFYYGGTTGVYHNYRFGTGYAKPVIYLYPEEAAEVTLGVEFGYGGRMTCSYPEYSDGWTVTAMPDGTLYDAEGNEYYCLFWEGEGNSRLDFGSGFCVKGEDTASFLREKLMSIGLTAREVNEFIIYWLPIVGTNEYNVITFHTDDYADSVTLRADPAPDSVIRVFVTFTPSDGPVDIAEQTLPSYERTGFTLVEWGGTVTE